jgi:DMSO/TMAO reductase YedYZ molybdopterin-dependent catalytic subunit
VIERMPMPVLHLEAEVPDPAPDWTLRVDGLVGRPLVLSVGQLQELPTVEVSWDFHCVWGWSRRTITWTGIQVGDLLELAGADVCATHAVFAAVDGPYASCLDLPTAGRGLVAWAMDGQPLQPDHGAPLRFVPPPDRWAYKGVKWLGQVELLAEARYGLWESLVGDPHGVVPPDRLELDYE